MPWCENCQRHYNPKSLAPDGTCMTCGAFIADEADQKDDERAPWHFWLLVGALVIYLGWRLIQLIVWLAT